MTLTSQPTIPLDIKAPWLNVARRMQSVAHTDNQGFAVISITILVNSDGLPIGWSSPKITCIEPKRSNLDLDNFMDAITDGHDG
jgi:hypothetical protein